MRSITVVGASLAGLAAARALRQQGYDGGIVVAGAEWHRPYDRPPLSKQFLAGTAAVTDLALTGPDDDALDVEWLLGRSAVQLDPAGAAVVLDSGERIRSDGVIIATGARARRLPGPPVRGVHTLRTIEDAAALRRALLPGARLVVIGAGFIGAEVAATAHGLGVDVTVVEALPTPLAAQLGVEMGTVCASLHADHDVRLVTGVGNARIVGSARVRGVRLADGRQLPADVVVAGIGAEPCVDWLTYSGLAVSGGVLIDARCATSIPAVVAAGDCTATRDPRTGKLIRFEHWNSAANQPAVAVATLLGKHDQQPASARVPYFWSDQYGCRLQFAGHRLPGDAVEIVEGDTGDRSFVAVYRRGASAVAVLAMNRPKSFGRWRRRLADPDGAPALSPAS